MIKLKIKDSIIEVISKTNFEVCDLTYRFSHFYEDPTWKGQLTTRQALDSYYQDTFKDKDYWKKKWSGSNLPDWVFDSFYDLKDLTLEEKMIVETVKTLKKPFYVIMYSEAGASDVRLHELAHAYWYLNPEYRRKCKIVLKKYKKQLEPLYNILQPVYSKDVLLDEMHVYAGIYFESFCEKVCKIHSLKPVELLKQLFYEVHNEASSESDFNSAFNRV